MRVDLEHYRRFRSIKQTTVENRCSAAFRALAVECAVKVS
jgi:hypothetical protein